MGWCTVPQNGKCQAPKRKDKSVLDSIEFGRKGEMPAGTIVTALLCLGTCFWYNDPEALSTFFSITQEVWHSLKQHPGEKSLLRKDMVMVKRTVV